VTLAGRLLRELAAKRLSSRVAEHSGSGSGSGGNSGSGAGGSHSAGSGSGGRAGEGVPGVGFKHSSEAAKRLAATFEVICRAWAGDVCGRGAGSSGGGDQHSSAWALIRHAGLSARCQDCAPTSAPEQVPKLNYRLSTGPLSSGSAGGSRPRSPSCRAHTAADACRSQSASPSRQQAASEPASPTGPVARHTTSACGFRVTAQAQAQAGPDESPLPPGVLAPLAAAEAAGAGASSSAASGGEGCSGRVPEGGGGGAARRGSAPPAAQGGRQQVPAEAARDIGAHWQRQWQEQLHAVQSRSPSASPRAGELAAGGGSGGAGEWRQPSRIGGEVAVAARASLELGGKAVAMSLQGGAARISSRSPSPW
jgi:hypothetical protein